MEIGFDFFWDTFAGYKIEGCFGPSMKHNEMPLMHALEANSFFLRVRNLEGEMIANAVLVLTPQGVVVQPLYTGLNIF